MVLSTGADRRCVHHSFIHLWPLLSITHHHQLISTSPTATGKPPIKPFHSRSQFQEHQHQPHPDSKIRMVSQGSPEGDPSLPLKLIFFPHKHHKQMLDSFPLSSLQLTQTCSRDLSAPAKYDRFTQTEMCRGFSRWISE